MPWLMEKLSRDQAELTVEGLLEGGGPLVPRPGSGYSHVRRATARSADAG